MFWAMWAIFALGILTTALGLLYIAFGITRDRRRSASSPRLLVVPEQNRREANQNYRKVG